MGSQRPVCPTDERKSKSHEVVKRCAYEPRSSAGFCYSEDMQIFHVISVTVPLLIALGLPRLLATPAAAKPQNRAILYAACLLFFVSWYLPSPLIDGRDTSFVTHFIGGGVFSALLWVYIARTKSLRLPLAWELAVVFALVSALGALNELFELLLVRTNVASITLTDTSWDILANTLGALTAFALYKITAG